MKWTPEAEAAVKKAPFFVRKKVRARVEEEAHRAGKQGVSFSDVKAAQARFLSAMAAEIKGYQVETCFGPSGCPNRAHQEDGLAQKIEALFKREDLLTFLKQRVKGDLKFHHEFRVSLADCPNACSQPQIKDIGIIGACAPQVTDESCTLCGACESVCKETAITIDSKNQIPDIDFNRCLNCGQCMRVCPPGAIAPGRKGFQVLLGGKLGRHPKLARDLPGIFSEEEVLEIVSHCIDFYKKHSQHGERFAELLNSDDFDRMVKRFAKQCP